MCKFFSFVEDQDGQYYAFLPQDRKGITIRGEEANYDSHTAICEYYNLDDDNVNKWEWNPFTGWLTLDTNSLIDARTDLALAWVKSLINSDDSEVKLAAVRSIIRRRI